MRCLDPDLPIYTVQINKVYGDNNANWIKIRETQRRISKEMKNVFVVPSLDLSLNDAIHNASHSNLVLGERMARIALEGFYKKPAFGFAPDICSAVCKDRVLTLSFDHVHHYIQTLGVPAKDCDFTVEDEEGTVGLDSYEGNAKNVILRLSRKLTGKAYVSYAKGSCLRSTPPLDPGSGLPILAFDREEITHD